MRNVAKVLARLYPAEWRERYGEEYEALLEERTPRLRDVADVFSGAVKMQLMSWSFVRIVLPCALVGGLLGFAVSFARPALYRSQALVQVATDDPRPLEQQLAAMLPDVLNEPLVISIIEKENLYPRERAGMPMSDVVDLVRKNIFIEAQRGGKTAPGFLILFSYPDPHVAQNVDEDLVSEFTRANLSARIAARLRDQLAAENDPATKSLLQSQLQQIAAPAVDWRGTFQVVDMPSLPKDPFYPKRGLFSMAGVVAGIMAGFVFAGWKRRVITAGS